MIKIDNKKIKTLRVKTGYSQKDFAESIKITPLYYNMIELGKKSCSISVVKKIADKLGVEWYTLYQEI